MPTPTEQIEFLKEFIFRDKFSYDGWDDRGLHSSDPELCEKLKNGFNHTAELMIDEIEGKGSKRRLKFILKQSISNCRPLHLDTEEKEFAADLFYELSAITEVNIKWELNIFLYGYFLVILIKTVKFFKPERIVETLKQKCTKCDTELIVHVMKKEQGIPDHRWVIGKCNNCGEYNLFSHGLNNKLLRYQNYAPVESLEKDQYNYEQALTRLEQIKYFRK